MFAALCGIAFAAGVLLPAWNIPIFILGLAFFWAAILGQVKLARTDARSSQVTLNESDSDDEDR
jgi:hypothetical protein